ncbi:MAG: class I SAM-dependent methyltransferase [Desulfatiglans sp.]|nr:class I SAM-dependent methyltransferase [Desulfatiglans sp.]
MISIEQNWKRYFIDHNEGMGTTYERFILHRYFQMLSERFDIKSILEVPSFGMTGVSGINSMWWAAKGVQVTVMDDDEVRAGLISEVWRGLDLPFRMLCQKGFSSLPFDDNSFDMAWNFAALRFQSGVPAMLREMARVSKKAVFICIPNRWNIFNLFRKSDKTGQSRSKQPDDSAQGIREVMEQQNWQLAEEGYLDVPPWPDIAMAKEDMLRKMGMGFIADRMQKRDNPGICILDWLNGKDPQMEERVLKYDLLENLPDPIKKFWAHHQYFLFIPGNEN